MINKIEAIHQTLVAMLRLLEEQAAVQKTPDPTTAADPVRSYSDDELMTVREAYLELKISRNTLDELRRQQKLTSVFKKRNVRLIRAEVEDAKRWYCMIKGKW